MAMAASTYWLVGTLPALITCLAACSATTDAEVGQDTPSSVSSVTIQEPFFTDTRNRHQGDTLQLRAALRDAAGAVLSGIPVSWLSRDTTRATITAGGLLTVGRTVSVSQNGIYTDPARVRVVATAGGVSDSLNLEFNGWSLGFSTDPVTLAQRVQGYLSSLIGAEGPPAVYLLCTDRVVSLYISTSFVTGSGEVTYRFSGQSATTENWLEASNFRALYYPAATDTAFARRLTAADSLLFRIHKFQGADVTATFVLRGASEVVPQVIAACA